MATTNHLSAQLWTASQNQPDVTVNSAIEVMDAAIGGEFTHNMASDSDWTVTTTGSDPRPWQFAALQITDTGVLLTTTRNIIVPSTKPKFYKLFNNTAQSLILKNSTGTGITVAAGMRAELQSNGTNVVRWTADI